MPSGPSARIGPVVSAEAASGSSQTCAKYCSVRSPIWPGSVGGVGSGSTVLRAGGVVVRTGPGPDGTRSFASAVAAGRPSTGRPRRAGAGLLALDPGAPDRGGGGGPGPDVGGSGEG